MTRPLLARAFTTASLAAAALVVGCGVEKSETSSVPPLQVRSQASDLRSAPGRTVAGRETRTLEQPIR